MKSGQLRAAAHAYGTMLAALATDAMLRSPNLGAVDTDAMLRVTVEGLAIEADRLRLGDIGARRFVTLGKAAFDAEIERANLNFRSVAAMLDRMENGGPRS